jgi:Lon protease-like protein
MLQPKLLLLLLLLRCSPTASLRWFSLVNPMQYIYASPEPNDAARERRQERLALYPLPAVYLPGSTSMLRNVEPRNIAMVREQDVIVASLLDGNRRRCAEVGSLLRIDDVQREAADSSGQVLSSAASSDVLMVHCTVIGRVQLLKCDNLDAWITGDTYLLADVCEYTDEEGSEQSLSDGVTEERLRADVADSIYRLVDALLLEEQMADGAADGINATAAVAALEEAASHIASGCWWEALEVWQRHCATRVFALQAQHQVERNEFVIDCKLKEGGVLQIPVQEHTLCDKDRRKLMDLDARAREALDEMGLDDAGTFQGCLEARTVRERAMVLRAGVLREAERLDRRAALRRALDAS